MEMRRKKRPALIDMVQMMQTREADRNARLWRGPATNLVHDHERAWRCLLQNLGGFEHLDHEGRLVGEEVVGGADAAEDPIDEADLSIVRRDIRTCLSEDGDEGVLAQEGALAAHVWTRDEEDALITANRTIVGDKTAPLGGQTAFDNRMPAADDLWSGPGVQHGPDPVAFSGNLGEGACDI